MYSGVFAIDIRYIVAVRAFIPSLFLLLSGKGERKEGFLSILSQIFERILDIRKELSASPTCQKFMVGTNSKISSVDLIVSGLLFPPKYPAKQIMDI